MDLFDFVLLVSSLANGITEIPPAVSLKDAGRIAFVGDAATGQAVFVSDPGDTPKNISFPTPSATRAYGPEIQINHASKVAAVDIETAPRNERGPLKPSTHCGVPRQLIEKMARVLYVGRLFQGSSHEHR